MFARKPNLSDGGAANFMIICTDFEKFQDKYDFWFIQFHEIYSHQAHSNLMFSLLSSLENDVTS